MWYCAKWKQQCPWKYCATWRVRVWVSAQLFTLNQCQSVNSRGYLQQLTFARRFEDVLPERPRVWGACLTSLHTSLRPRAPRHRGLHTERAHTPSERREVVCVERTLSLLAYFDPMTVLKWKKENETHMLHMWPQEKLVFADMIVMHFVCVTILQKYCLILFCLLNDSLVKWSLNYF